MATEHEIRFIGLIAILKELSKDDPAILWNQEITELAESAINLTTSADVLRSWVGDADRQGGSFTDREIIESTTWR
jgi:hypothetical protein